jgi:hypothetical protein
MDTNTFALIVLGFGTVIVSIIVWQIFVTARARLAGGETHDAKHHSDRITREQARLGARLTALADDVQALERRVDTLDRNLTARAAAPSLDHAPGSAQHE